MAPTDKIQLNGFKYEPKGQGVQYSVMIRSPEEETHFYPKVEGDTKGIKSFFQQNWELYSFSQQGILTTPIAGFSFGGNTNTENVRAPSVQLKQNTQFILPGLATDADSDVESSHYINGIGLHLEQTRRYKMANIVLFADDSHQRMLWLEASNMLEGYKADLGMKDSIEELIHDSKSDQVLTCPWFGNFAFHMSSNTAFPNAVIASFKLASESTLRQMQDVIVNNFKKDAKNTASFVTPKLALTGKSLKKESLQANLITKYAWLEDYENNINASAYREVRFKTMRKIGEATFEKSDTTKWEKISCDVTGMCTQFYLSVAPSDEHGAEFQNCDDNGKDFITTAQVLLNNRPHSDCVHASFMSGPAWLESWGCKPERKIYLILDLENNPLSPFFTGGLITTGFNTVDVVCQVPAHAEP
jgi:hypothetical protein